MPDIADLIAQYLGPQDDLGVTDATLTKQTSGARDPANPAGGTQPTSTDYPARGMVDRSMAVLWMPPGAPAAIEAAWLADLSARGPGVRLVEAALRATRILWSDRRAIIYAAGEELEAAFDAVLRFTLVERDTALEAGQVGAQAVVHAFSEGDVRDVVATDVVGVRIGVVAVISIGGAKQQQHRAAGWNRRAVAFEILCHPTRDVRAGGFESQRLVDRTGQQ